MSEIVLACASVGYASNWPATGAGKSVAVALPDDGNSTYISSDVEGFVQAFDVEILGTLPGGSTVNNLSSRIRARRAISGSSTLSLFARLAGSNGSGTSQVVSSTTFNDHTVLLNRPGGGSWTVADLSGGTLQVGVDTLVAGGSNAVRITTWTVVVDVTLPPPVVTTGAATNVTISSASLNGTVNPSGATADYPVSYFFEWGPTVAYGNTTTPVAGQTGSADIAATAALSGLSGNTTYHFRLVATYSGETVNGSDGTFTTGMTDTPLRFF